jgi:YaiO family outer membrane protein
VTPLLFALLLAAPDTVTAPRWRAGLNYGFEAFTRDRATWQAASAQLGRRFAHGTLIGELITATRFDLTDRGAALDGYQTLWRRSYGNLRVQVVPDSKVLPRLDVSAEVYQALAGAFEVSAAYRRMQFTHDRANLFSAGLGKYTGNWYLRARTTIVPKSGTTGVSGSLAVRRYLASADDFLDVQVGLGQELITVGSGPNGPDIQVRANRFVALRIQKFVTPAIGVSVGATYNGTDGFPDRRGLSAGASYRW